ncbi:MAG: Holliday junction resolvase RuvX [Pyrinomonadaceae bacterium]
MPKTESHQAVHTPARPEKLAGRLLALDLGQKRVGVAVSDELCLTVRPLSALQRTNWKRLLRAVAETIKSFDARGLVLGLPLQLDGTEGEAAQEARRLARNFELSLNLPVYLQDERLTSVEAEGDLRAAGFAGAQLKERVDGESAAIILRDFIEQARNAENAS